MSMIPQGAMNSLHPMMRVRDQIMDGMIDHDLGLVQGGTAGARANEALDAVELDRKVATCIRTS